MNCSLEAAGSLLFTAKHLLPTSSDSKFVLEGHVAQSFAAPQRVVQVTGQSIVTRVSPTRQSPASDDGKERKEHLPSRPSWDVSHARHGHPVHSRRDRHTSGPSSTTTRAKATQTVSTSEEHPFRSSSLAGDVTESNVGPPIALDCSKQIDSPNMPVEEKGIDHSDIVCAVCHKSILHQIQTYPLPLGPQRALHLAPASSTQSAEGRLRPQSKRPQSGSIQRYVSQPSPPTIPSQKKLSVKSLSLVPAKYFH